MGLYDRYILPTLLHVGCSAKPIRHQRQKIVPLAEGRVLEVGFGSGLNLPFYDSGRVTEILGLEPSAGMRAKAKRRVEKTPLPVSFLELEGAEIPLEKGSVDSVLITYTMCTIAEVVPALQEMRRVLRPGGKLLFCEHGRAPDEAVRHWQDRINPVWRRIAGGCNLNRAIPELIEQGGFRIAGMDTMYLPNTPKSAGFNYWGTAEPA